MQIQQQILAGTAPAGLHIDDDLVFTGSPALKTLPPALSVPRLVLDNCDVLIGLPEKLRCYDLSMKSTTIRTLPDDLQVTYRLDLTGCTQLETLPKGLKVGSLILRDCTSLRTLPEDLDVYFLDITNCRNLESFPVNGHLRGGKLLARNCSRLRALPDWLTQLAQLDVSDCVNLGALPVGLEVSEWLDVANTQLTGLPASLRGVQLRWRDVVINEQIAFAPETLSAEKILHEGNAELRRVMLERKGYEAFMAEARARVLDQDIDPGGERRLLHVNVPRDEPLVCLAVKCPSTARQYLLRVPPTTRTCRQAAAWIAGYDNPDDYRPLAET